MNTSIEYDYLKNGHSETGADEALTLIFDQEAPNSILDVGCGPGKWLRAIQKLGITDFLGIDGIDMISTEYPELATKFTKVDLTLPLELGRTFEVAICLEVAEHLPKESAENLIDILTGHADTVIFSAACPGQPGQNHINCQWPSYWQNLFNQREFACSDKLRWKIWNFNSIEPWYRQNIFIAERTKGFHKNEAAICPVIHPDLLGVILESKFQVPEMPIRWHASKIAKKIRRKILG